MIRHVLLFRFREDTSEEQGRGLLDELGTFPRQFPAMQRFRLGENRSQRDDTFPWVMLVEFAQWEGLEDYLASPAHEMFVRYRFAPLIAARAIASIED